MSTGRHPLYQAALDADETFRRNIVRVYGEKRAGDMRYQSTKWTDRALIAASIRKMRADDRWIKHMLASRQTNPMKRRGSFPRGKCPPHLKRYLFKKKRR